MGGFCSSNWRDEYAIAIKIELQKDRNSLLITTPPRLNGLGIKTQSYQRIAEPFE